MFCVRNNKKLFYLVYVGRVCVMRSTTPGQPHVKYEHELLTMLTTAACFLL